MRVVTLSAAVCLALVTLACAGSQVSQTLSVVQSTPTEPAASSTERPADSVEPTRPPTEAPRPTDPPATPAPTATPTPAPAETPASGPVTADCINGWVSPAPGSAEYEHALGLLSVYMGVGDTWTVDEMRYFTGPELPFVEPQYESVERWYVKAALADDPTFRGRWLLERRTDLIQGISAVARHDSLGYSSPDWKGFVGEGPLVTYDGLPGTWSGIPYDFVTGEGDSGNPGLPDEVAGCMTGT